VSHGCLAAGCPHATLLFGWTAPGHGEEIGATIERINRRRSGFGRSRVRLGIALARSAQRAGEVQAEDRDGELGGHQR